MKKLKVATVFSGIGAIEQALKKKDYPHEIVFACDNGGIEVEYNLDEEKEKISKMNKIEMKNHIDEIYNFSKRTNYVEVSYKANYKIKDNMFFQDIRLLDGKKFRGEIDLLVGGSPCQSFSLMGKRAGLEDTRGTLFYDFARLINEIQPEEFIYENVRGLVIHDKGNTWKVIKEVFDSLGYDYTYSIENAKNYGIPQNRDRIFVVGKKKKSNNKLPKFNNKVELKTKLNDYLEKSFDKKYILPEKGFKFVTNPKYSGRAKINADIMRCQKANQQYNWNGDFISLKSKYKDRYSGEYDGIKSHIRKLTPRECLRLMGFGDDFKIVVSDTQIYKQSGNSIVVNILEKILEEIYE